MPASLHLLFSDALPHGQGEEEEDEVMMVETDDAELPADGEQPVEAYGFVTTVLANYEDLDELRRDVTDWWQDAAGVQPTLELLTSDPALMGDETRAAAARLEPGYWNTSTFVGFLKTSPSARAEARGLVMESVMKVQ
ncbi:MAG TPA: hypothetical protein VF310_15490 [Vicinamibacteria bacterium]